MRDMNEDKEKSAAVREAHNLQPRIHGRKPFTAEACKQVLDIVAMMSGVVTYKEIAEAAGKSEVWSNVTVVRARQGRVGMNLADDFHDAAMAALRKKYPETA